MTRLKKLLTQTGWPLPLKSYDRQALTSDEHGMLAVMLKRRDAALYWFDRAQIDLARLVAPVVNAARLFDTKPKYRNGLLSDLLRDQYDRSSVFWEWTDDQWNESFRMVVERKHQGIVGNHLGLLLHTAYLLGGPATFAYHERFDSLCLAQLVFQPTDFAAQQKRVVDILVKEGFQASWCETHISRVVAALFLAQDSTNLSAISLPDLQAVHDARMGKNWQKACVRIGFALQQLALLPAGLDTTFVPQTAPHIVQGARSRIHPDWLSWVDRWAAATAYSPANRKTHYRCLLLVGRWLAREHPEVTTPEGWTRDLAVTYVAAVDRLTVGGWSHLHNKHSDGKPLRPHTKSRYLAVMRAFFTDLQEWGWIRRRFDPQRCLAVPRTIQGLIEPNPKPVDADVWHKLVIAALNLSEADAKAHGHWLYPVAMLRAVAVVWVMTALRPDEIRRLRVGCVQDHQTDTGQVSLLAVPPNKLNPSYTKPVDPVVAQVVTAWEQVRPETMPREDPKTGERVHYLFQNGNQHIAKGFLSRALIPLLCRVAGVPDTDSLGRITPNRARHTVAYQLANGRDPMPLLELQAWLGHRNPDSTMHYTVRTHLELSQAVERHTIQQTRLVAVLVDREAITNGETAQGEPWKYYDVGHGYCTYDFFETCPHRMACARCTAYVPKDSSLPQFRQMRQNLLRMREEVSLTDEMVAAVDEGVAAVEALLVRLADTPTPSGPTPRQLGSADDREVTLILPSEILIRPSTSSSMS
jgi:integrase